MPPAPATPVVRVALLFSAPSAIILLDDDELPSREIGRRWAMNTSTDLLDYESISLSHAFSKSQRLPTARRWVDKAFIISAFYAATTIGFVFVVTREVKLGDSIDIKPLPSAQRCA